MAISKDKALKSRTVEFVFKLFIKNLQEGQFSNFDAHKYAAYLLKRASAKYICYIFDFLNESRDVNEANRKFLYTIQKEFSKYVAPGNPLGINLNADDDDLGDEGVQVEILSPKNGIFFLIKNCL